MLAYKGFDKNLKCRNFQYEIGKTYEEDEAVLCKSGFHACLNPIDILNYYPPCTSRYCLVEIENYCSYTDTDSKICGTKITIIKELSIQEFCKASLKYNSYNTGYHKQTTSSYDNALTNCSCTHAQTSGRYSHAQTSGSFSHAQTSNDASHAQTSSSQSHAQVSGNGSHAKTGGFYSHAQTSGPYSHAQTNGDSSHAQACGLGSHVQASGRNSIACSIGNNSYGMLEKDAAALILVEYDDFGNFKKVHIGIPGENIEYDKTYTIKNGTFTEI